MRGVIPVVDRDHLAVGALHATAIADVTAAAVIAQDDAVRPGFSAIAAEARTDAERFLPVAKDQAQAAVLELDEAGRVPDAHIRIGLAFMGPVLDGLQR